MIIGILCGTLSSIFWIIVFKRWQEKKWDEFFYRDMREKDILQINTKKVYDELQELKIRIKKLEQ